MKKKRGCNCQIKININIHPLTSSIKGYDAKRSEAQKLYACL
jgi:hypothetical protein